MAIAISHFPLFVADQKITRALITSESPLWFYFWIERYVQGVCLVSRLVRNCRQEAWHVPSVPPPSGKTRKGFFRENLHLCVIKYVRVATGIERLRASGPGENPEAVRRSTPVYEGRALASRIVPGTPRGPAPAVALDKITLLSRAPSPHVYEVRECGARVASSRHRDNS